MAEKKATAKAAAEETAEELKVTVPEQAVDPEGEAEAALEETVSDDLGKKEPSVAKKSRSRERVGMPISDEIDEAILNARNKVSRGAFPLESASKTAKKKIYHSEHILTEDGDAEVETYGVIRRREMLELISSARSNKILKGTITGYREVDTNSKDSDEMMLAEVEYGTGTMEVLIPSFLLFNYDVAKYDTKDAEGTYREYRDSIKRSLASRIGSEIEFVVTQVNEKDGIAYADRLKAMSLKGVFNYAKLQRDSKPNIIPGMLIQAVITQTARTFVIASAFGAEFRIPYEELSWLHIGDARNEFKVNQKINCKVLAVTKTTVTKYKNNYTLINVTASVKQAEPDMRKVYFDRFKEGGKYKAEVIWVSESGIFCKLNKYTDVLVAFPKFGDLPVRGEVRIVSIFKKDDEKMQLAGTFVSH